MSQGQSSNSISKSCGSKQNWIKGRHLFKGNDLTESHEKE